MRCHYLTVLDALMLTLRHLLFVREVESIDTRILHGLCPVFRDQSIKLDHALRRNACLCQVDAHQCVLESLRYEKLLKRPSEAVIQLNVV